MKVELLFGGAVFILGWCFLLGQESLNNDKELRIAWMAPEKEYHNFSAISSVGALRLALHTMEEKFLQDYTVRIKWYNTDCNSKLALGLAVEAYVNFKPHLFLGPPCSECLKGVAQLASYWNIPVFSWVSHLLDFGDAKMYTTLIRLFAGVQDFDSNIDFICILFKWKRFALVHDKRPPYKGVSAAVKNNKKAEILSDTPISNDMKDEEIENTFLQIKKYARVIIFAVPWRELRRYLLVAHRLGWANGEFAFVCVHGDLFTSDDYESQILSSWGWKRGNDDDEKAREIFEYVIHFIIDPLNPLMYNGLKNYTVEAAKNQRPHWELPNGTSIDAYAPYLFDAATLWAKAVNESIRDGIDHRDGRELQKRVIHLEEEGLTGKIAFNKQNNGRMLNFQFLDMDENGNFYKLLRLTYTAIGMRPETDADKGGKSELSLNGRWPTKDGKPPPDVPVCGFNGEKCGAKQEEEYVGIILGASISASVVFTLAVAVHLMLRRYRRLQFLQSMLWQVKFEEIDFLTTWIIGSIRASFRNLHKRKLSSKVAKRSQHKGHYDINAMGNNKKGDRSPNTPQKHMDHGGMFGSVASVRGSLASVKRLSFRVNVNLTKTMTLDLNQLMEIKHQNVCAFVGACIETNRVLLFWEYCPKGSLQDIIWNQNIKLEDMFRFALCHDVAKGLEFIHKSSIRYHGNLKSTNCVVDSRWTCKITDFGVPSLRAIEKMSAVQNGEEEHYDKMLWSAPEVLLGRKDVDRQKTDIFSLGIILKEVFTRSGPYAEYPFLTNYEIVAKIRDNMAGSSAFRPVISIQLKQHTELTALMEDCWHEDPAHRPTAAKVLKILNRINPSKNLTMIDNMIAMLEKYANHLEDLVAERTSELDAEKKKTENLLYRMLPQSVAEDLKLGKPVKAEHFDEVTIYFSDIVGFTTICASSTPIEAVSTLKRTLWTEEYLSKFKLIFQKNDAPKNVVNLLNSLYTLFDATITRYDVYKVETIGDAYMIASGLPQRNGKKHIREIADCALDILASISTFRVPHQPDRNVKLRIGIHTGPVVTGVVGLAMPRYCLFGDTVNTASRMESNGLPLRIHMSEVSKKQLVQYPGYHLKSRGEITVKGKGKMKTYFLCGKDGFTKELPKWDEKENTNKTSIKSNSNNDSRPSVSSILSDVSFVSCASSSSPIVSPSLNVSVSDLWDERYKSKQTSILEVTCL